MGSLGSARSANEVGFQIIRTGGHRAKAYSVAVALARNAIVVARPSDIAAFSLETGRQLWAQMLPGTPVGWGLAVNSAGRVIVALEGGQVLCFGQQDLKCREHA
jgi:hypothetical protein